MGRLEGVLSGVHRKAEYYDEYGEELYEDEGVVPADGLDPVTFCEEWAPEDGGFIPPPNWPREGVNCRELLR